MNTKKTLLISLFSFLLVSCNQSEQGSELAESPLETNVQQASYIIGYSTMSQLVSRGELELDNTAILNGVRDALNNADSRLSEEVMQQAMTQYQEQIQAKVKEKQETLAAKNLATSQAYMAENATKEGVVVDKSGIQYKVLTEGKGPKPQSVESTVRVNYEGRLIDGTVFDSSYQRGEPIEFALNRVIKGWTEALQLMPEGSTWEITIPPELGYGAGGTGSVIGPNATLIFKVELIKSDVVAEKK